MGTRHEFLEHLDCRKNGFEKLFFLLRFPLYFHWKLKKKGAALFPSSTQGDTANLKNFSFGLGSLALLIVVSKSKDIKIPIPDQDKKENSPFSCCHEAEMQKMAIQRCPAMTFCWSGLLNSFVSWPRSLLVSPWGEQRGSQEGSCCPFAVLLMLWAVECYCRSLLF